METRYDLQHILFTNNIQAFLNRGTRRKIGTESIIRSQLNQTTSYLNNEVPKTWPALGIEEEEEEKEGNIDIMMEDTKENIKNLP